MLVFTDPISGLEYGVEQNNISTNYVYEMPTVKNIIISMIPFNFVNSIYRKMQNDLWPDYSPVNNVDAVDIDTRTVEYIHPQLKMRVKVPYTVA